MIAPESLPLFLPRALSLTLKDQTQNPSSPRPGINEMNFARVSSET